MEQSTAALLSPEQKTAIRRWKLGHHIFHIYLFAMNTNLHTAREQLHRESWDQLVDSLQSLVQLYDAATASMKYAADMDRAEYQSLIRPSMAPPFLKPGFSGQQNKDHTTMVQLIRKLRREIRERGHRDNAYLPQEVYAAAKALWEAQARNRRHHILVCDRLVPGEGSLLQTYFASIRSRGISKEGN
ncbi:hypothetical protein [Mycobacterium sp. 852002-40037_SCH5390672]|uniref:hypothetical protein n=1 Tax=Mycobacterium sp. 852002-40037_SCH5390672 TaxID=1834089 RepID=UPI000AB4477F|nr:hypothetical protein [Mycobacterium sp. 852002-40037_SCH5390672]